MLKFASKQEALQHLSDLTGERIKIARVESEIYDYMDDEISFGLSFSSDIGTSVNVDDIQKEKQDLMSESTRQYERAVKILQSEDIDFTPLKEENKVLFYIEPKGNKLTLSTDVGFGFSFNNEEDMERAKSELDSL
jgi:hypothetical protein